MISENSSLSIVIIGGSLSGLYTAVVLKCLSCVGKITIVERLRESQLQDQGAGIRTNQEAIDAILEFTGVPPEKYAAKITALKTLSREGGVISNIEVDYWSSTWGQLYRVLRHEIANDAKCQYRNGCNLVNIRNTSGQEIDVEFENEDDEIETLSSNIVIGADGASSKVRSLMLPEVKRTSAGYVCYRGLVPLVAIPGPVQDVYDKSGTFSWPEDSIFVSYLVPADNNPADQAENMVNWVWYQDKTEAELESLLTDKGGKKHAFSIGHGQLRQEEIDKVKDKARHDLPSTHAEVVAKTAEPFVQVVTDSLANEVSFFNGKVILIGDAVGGQRPHTASAFWQCAYHALLLRQFVVGDTPLKDCARQIQAFSTILVEVGKQLGIYTQKTGMPSKISLYMKLFLRTQAELEGKWKENIGDVKTLAST